MLSAFATPESSKQLCKERDKDTPKQPSSQGATNEAEACVLPLPAAEGAAVGSSASSAAAAGTISAVPLLAGLAALAGVTALLLSKGDKSDQISFPLSPS